MLSVEFSITGFEGGGCVDECGECNLFFLREETRMKAVKPPHGSQHLLGIKCSDGIKESGDAWGFLILETFV